ncbi:hypothetical protein DPMN_151189 [Dreissena polymorpha]|uniref:EF-hand domain-containing protein n=1 Tax=Dreissena polymorpha TaxID=45954 RepID=A0A9D4FF46_DREPO|nr:hypothetical protein DPMN_151189 [Dreissena polymorpha]
MNIEMILIFSLLLGTIYFEGSNADQPDMYKLINMLFLKADANLDGKITQAEFSAVVQAFDKNGDGAVTHDEFVDGWVALTKQTRAVANAYFHVGDLNHDKVIDQKDHDIMYTVFDQNEILLPSDTCKVPNGICETRCRCKEGFIALNDSCLGKIGTTCTMQSDCIPEAACDNTFGGGTCTCNDGLVADLNNTECRLKVGAICDQHSGTCVEHSECINGQCTCKNGYQADGNGSKTCKEKEDGLKDIIWIFIGSVTGFLLVLAVVTCTVTHYCCRKKLQNLC